MLMHSRILVYSYDTLWRRWTVPKCSVRSNGIIAISPPFDSSADMPVVDNSTVLFEHR